jgi:hypothetical protein
MAHDHSHQPEAFAQLASTVGTPEQFGVVFMNDVLRSAIADKITSADGKSLVVPFGVTVTPAPTQTSAAGKLDTVICNTVCWKILGRQVCCYQDCRTIHPAVAPERSPPNDQTLLGLVTPGPSLPNPDLVDQGLLRSLWQAGSSMEAGVVLTNAVYSTLSQRADLIGADGAAQLTGVATISLPQPASSPRPADGYTSECHEICITILGAQVVCLERCHIAVQ